MHVPVPFKRWIYGWPDQLLIENKEYPGLLYDVIWQMGVNVVEEPTVSVYKAEEEKPEDGNSRFFWNMGTFLHSTLCCFSEERVVCTHISTTLRI